MDAEATRVGKGALERSEMSWPGERSAIPDQAIRLLRAIVCRAELVPIAELVTCRRRLEIRAPSGERLAGIDDDTVASSVTASRPPGSERLKSAPQLMVRLCSSPSSPG